MSKKQSGVLTKMDELEYQQTVAQWEHYQALIAGASQSRSDAIQLQKAVANQLKTLEKPAKNTENH